MENLVIKSFKNPNPDVNLVISDLSHLLSEQDLIEKYHRHDFYFLLLIEEGSGVHQIDFVQYTEADYSLFFIQLGYVHQLYIKKQTKGYIVSFEESFYASIGGVKIELIFFLMSLKFNRKIL